ncbi:hypothetical protein CAPTEDRAFT_196694 [Capitella teleta]|uniref:CARD domain-containing protein n=1 Tax=Capitella teleta TaxID=283909 RepID=R7V6E5_CAPTE|nr:hypothetical protein CAPTEDRAFT_196694 [Capitella teleta]|eukprot:ELU11926.1 hypothetical protein CAPTEDRAFT_196694 [Capitella teleta]
MKSFANLPYMYHSHKMCGIVRLDESDEVYTLAWHLTEVYQLMEYVLMNLARVTECGSEDELQTGSMRSMNVREQLVGRYSRLRHISTAPERAAEIASDSAKFYISLHLQEGETVTTILKSQEKMALSEERKLILTDKRIELVASIKLLGLWSHLRSHKIVTEQDEEMIKINRTSYEQIAKLLDHLAKRTERDFEAFCECLEKDNQGHIVTEILRYSAPSPSNEDVREQLAKRSYCLGNHCNCSRMDSRPCNGFSRIVHLTTFAEG